ncbi:MAG: hypothetical protein ABI413_13595 [Ktedonobacteraceae bacterium]
MEKNRPQWQAITMLPTVAQHIGGMLEADQEQYATLLEAKPKPHVLDDDTVNRVISAFTTQRNDLGLFDEQLRRWGIEPKLTTAQRAEVSRLKQQMASLRQANTNVLKLAEELKRGTINRIMEMGDAELGLRSLLGDLPGQQQKR